MDFSQSQFETSLNIDLFIKNARSLKICGSYSGYEHFPKYSNDRKIPIHELIFGEGTLPWGIFRFRIF